jgi:TolA-binding protein
MKNMTNNVKSSVIGLLIGLFMISSFGCVALKTREEVNQSETSRATQTQVTQLQTQKAEADNKVLVLQDELRQLNGRLDMLEKREQEQNQAANAQTGPTNKDIIEQMKIFEQNNIAMKAKIEELETKLAAAQKAQATAATEKAAATTASKDKKSKSKEAKDAYQTADDLFNKKEWKSAILSYQAYRDANPKGSHYAQATYKIGVSFQELKMKDEAKVFFEEVVQKFPKSSAARKSKFRLSQLK